jgi:hypothetical protein
MGMIQSVEYPKRTEEGRIVSLLELGHHFSLDTGTPPLAFLRLQLADSTLWGLLVSISLVNSANKSPVCTILVHFLRTPTNAMSKLADILTL